MDLSLYIAFLLTSATLILVPGPNVLVIISTSIAHGKIKGLQVVLGTSCAMAIQLFIAAVGTTWLIETLSAGFTWIKWFGVVYLLYLGINHFFQLRKINIIQPSSSSTFTRGFIVSLTNPKTILFFVAFLPQFISGDSDYSIQIFILSITFLALAIVLDSLYAALSGHFANYSNNRNIAKVQHSASGTLYLSASIWLTMLQKE